MMPEPTILTREDDLLVVDKPSGWLVHTAGTDAPDVLGFLAAQGEEWQAAHRLDAGTSGVLLLARGQTLTMLTAGFAEQKIAKTYQALVFGRTRDKGVIRRALADGRRGRPLEAITRYRTVERFERWSLLELKPETGRKHQIRRHLQGIGHALIGDDRYRPRGKPTVPAFPGRLWLHCSALVLPDGRAFEAHLPAELEAHLSVLRA